MGGRRVKALTIRQPYADAIVHGPKRVENRTRRTHLRGPILIHAGATTYAAVGRLAIEEITGQDPDTTWPGVRGAIIGTARLTGCHIADGCCRPWGQTNTIRSEPYTWHWTLADVLALPEPVPAKGALGFWTPPPAVLAAVEQQLAATPA
jgi:hypothetical protein